MFRHDQTGIFVSLLLFTFSCFAPNVFATEQGLIQTAPFLTPSPGRRRHNPRQRKPRRLKTSIRKPLASGRFAEFIGHFSGYEPMYFVAGADRSAGEVSVQR